MANEENLIPNSKRTPSELREQCRKGGIKSGEVRREKRLWKDEIMKRLGEKDWNEIVDNLIDRAKKNSKDYEVLRDTMGQKPTENAPEKETPPPIVNIEIKDNSEVQKEFEKFDT